MKGVQRLELFYVRGRGEARQGWRDTAKALG
jgi:hypothetical protein